MQINVTKNELAGALPALGKLVCRTSPVKTGRAMLVEVQGSHLELQTRMSDEAISYKMVVDGVEPFRVIVDFEAFRSAVRATRNKFISLRYENGALHVDDVQIPQVSDSWKQEPIQTSDFKTTVFPAGFLKNFADAAVAIDRNDYRATLRGIHLCPQGVVATNGKMLMHVDQPMEIDALTIPFPLALLATKCQSDGLLLSWSDHQKRYFTIKTGNWMWTAKALDGQYPNWQIVIPKSTSASVQLKPEAIPALKELLRPHDKVAESVHLQWVNDGLQVKIADKTICVDAAFFGGDEFEIIIASDILNTMLRSGLDRISINDEKTPFVATRSDSPIRMIAMPMFASAKQVEKEKSTAETTAKPKEEKVETKDVKVGEPKVAKPPVQVVGNNANPMQAVLDSIDAMKTKLRDALEATTELGHQVRDAIRVNQQRERNYASMMTLMERIKTAL